MQEAASQQRFRDLFEEAEQLREEIAYISGDFRLSGPERDAQKKPLQQRLEAAEAHIETLAKKHGGTRKLAAMLGLGRERDFDRERAERVRDLRKFLKQRHSAGGKLRKGSIAHARARSFFNHQIERVLREDPELKRMHWRDPKGAKAMLREAERQRIATERYCARESARKEREERDLVHREAYEEMKSRLAKMSPKEREEFFEDLITLDMDHDYEGTEDPDVSGTSLLSRLDDQDLLSIDEELAREEYGADQASDGREEAEAEQCTVAWQEAVLEEFFPGWLVWNGNGSGLTQEKKRMEAS